MKPPDLDTENSSDADRPASPGSGFHFQQRLRSPNKAPALPDKIPTTLAPAGHEAGTGLPPSQPEIPHPPLASPRRPVTHTQRQKTLERQVEEQRENLRLVDDFLNQQRWSKHARRTMSESPTLQSHQPIVPAILGVPGSFPDIRALRHDTDPKGHGFPRGFEHNNNNNNNNNDDENLSHNWDINGSQGHTNSNYSDQIAPDLESQSDVFNDPSFWEELALKFNLCLSMQFRDGSDREKFFITYIDKPNLWRKVTISCDYRKAPENSLELTLKNLCYQRHKIARIYEAIRDSLDEIQFYDTVTNLKLETISRRLHVHVAEDINEITQFPTVDSIAHLDFELHNNIIVPESEVIFVAHLSGFVYQVAVHGRRYIKKEISTPDTVQEFLYEINALAALRNSPSVIGLIGVVVDDKSTVIKGLLIEWASGGSIADFLYENSARVISWERKEKWARQVIAGIADIHDAGFVQGDCTISNIVLDDKDNIKIVDINRRGCPIGWEPPEFDGYIRSGLKLFLYIGVKSDLYQLGMILWAIAKQIEEPERQEPPLRLDDDIYPAYFREIVHTCLSENPEGRKPASYLLTQFPTLEKAAVDPKSGRARSPLSAAEQEDVKEHLQVHPRHRRAQESGTLSSRPNSTTFQLEEMNQQEVLLAGINPFSEVIPSSIQEDPTPDIRFPPPVHQDSGLPMGEEDVIAGIHAEHRRKQLEEIEQRQQTATPRAPSHPKRRVDIPDDRNPPIHTDSGFAEYQNPDIPTSAGLPPYQNAGVASQLPQPTSHPASGLLGAPSSNTFDSNAYIGDVSSRKVELSDRAPDVPAGATPTRSSPQPQEAQPTIQGEDKSAPN